MSASPAAAFVFSSITTRQFLSGQAQKGNLRYHAPYQVFLPSYVYAADAPSAGRAFFLLTEPAAQRFHVGKLIPVFRIILCAVFVDSHIRSFARFHLLPSYHG
jgi:hypothetical protein